MKTIEMSEARRLVAEGDKMSPADRKALQQQRLHELVAYAREHSPWLSALYADVPTDFTLTDLPIVQKQDMLEHFDDYVTDRRIHIKDVLAYIDRPVDDNSLFLGQYTALKTSGSTGRPLPMVRDDYHNKIHGQLMAQRLMGGIPPEILSLRHNRAASVIHLDNGASSYGAFLRTKAAFSDVADNLIGLSCLDNVDHLVEQLNEFRPSVLTGYPSMLVPLAVEQMKGHLHIDVKLVCTSAEMLTDKDYQVLSDAFRCPVVNNYCMTEGGEVAMTRGGSRLHINEDWVIVEPVGPDMKPLGIMMPKCLDVVTSNMSKCQDVVTSNMSKCLDVVTSNMPKCQDVVTSNMSKCQDVVTSNMPKCQDVVTSNMSKCLDVVTSNMSKCLDVVMPKCRNIELSPTGPWSAGLLITDLTNYVQPVIRYYVSDVVRIYPSPVDSCNLPCLEIRGRKLDNYTICGQTFSVAGLVTEAEVWPGLVKYQFVQTDDETLQVRGLCAADAEPSQVLGGLCAHLKDFLARHGCPHAKVTWSAEPFIPNKRGGKIPTYVKHS